MERGNYEGEKNSMSSSEQGKRTQEETKQFILVLHKQVQSYPPKSSLREYKKTSADSALMHLPIPMCHLVFVDHNLFCSKNSFTKNNRN